MLLLTYGADMDFSGILGGIGSAISGGLSYLSQQQTNAQNLMMNTGAWKAQQVSDEAKALGLSPLAVLGNTGANIPMQSVTAPDLGPLGQGIGRAVSGRSPADELTESLLKARIAGVQADTAYTNMQSAVLAKKYSDPSLPGVSNVTAIPESFRKSSVGLPMYGLMHDESGNVYEIATRDYSTRSFGSGSEPTSRVAGDISALRNVRRNARDLKYDWGSQPSGPFQLGPITVRPDTARKFQDRLPWDD